MIPITREAIRTIIRIQLGFDRVSDDARFIEDLGTESADFINIIAAVEEKFNVQLNEQDIARVRTVEDLYLLAEKQR